MTMSNNRTSRILVLAFCFCMLFTFFVSPVQEAHAALPLVVGGLSVAAVAAIAAILVACGFTFSDTGSLSSAVSDFLSFCGPAGVAIVAASSTSGRVVLTHTLHKMIVEYIQSKRFVGVEESIPTFSNSQVVTSSANTVTTVMLRESVNVFEYSYGGQTYNIEIPDRFPVFESKEAFEAAAMALASSLGVISGANGTNTIVNSLLYSIPYATALVDNPLVYQSSYVGTFGAYNYGVFEKYYPALIDFGYCSLFREVEAGYYYGYRSDRGSGLTKDMCEASPRSVTSRYLGIMAGSSVLVNPSSACYRYNFTVANTPLLGAIVLIDGVYTFLCYFIENFGTSSNPSYVLQYSSTLNFPGASVPGIPVGVASGAIAAATSSVLADSTFFPTSDGELALDVGTPVYYPDDAADVVGVPAGGTRSIDFPDTRQDVGTGENTGSTVVPDTDIGSTTFDTTGEITGEMTEEGEGGTFLRKLLKFVLNIPILGSLLQWLINIYNLISSIIGTLAGYFTAVLENIGNFFGDARNFFRDILDLIRSFFGNLGNLAPSLLAFLLAIPTYFFALINHFMPAQVAIIFTVFIGASILVFLARLIFNR